MDLADPAPGKHQRWRANPHLVCQRLPDVHAEADRLHCATLKPSSRPAIRPAMWALSIRLLDRFGRCGSGTWTCRIGTSPDGDGDADFSQRVLGGSQALLRGDRVLARSCTSSSVQGECAPSLTSSSRSFGGLAANWIEADRRHRLRRVVDHHVHAGHCSKARMSGLRDDDPALHTVTGRSTADTTDSEVCSEAIRLRSPADHDHLPRLSASRTA